MSEIIDLKSPSLQMQHLVIETELNSIKGRLCIARILSSNSYECVHKILFQTEPEWKTVMMLLSVTVKTVPDKENQREAQAALIVTSLVALINFFLL